MSERPRPITVKVLESIGAVSPAAWDACVRADADPFVSHAFLKTLEDSGAVRPETGWLPQHLVVEEDRGGIAACAPLYLKSHSYGEYVFDWAWADALERAGGRYYPKLQSSVPFTPVTGSRLLTRPDAPDDLKDALAGAMIQLAERLKVSSLHVTFPTESEWRRLGSFGLLLRLGKQFHWQNQGYETFEDFLGNLSSRKRKVIRRERRAVVEHGIAMRILTGADIAEHHWDTFYGFYRDTSDRKWGPAYLNRDFFSHLHASMGDRIVLVLAESAGHPVGGALNLMGSSTLYGRYWGCSQSYRFLHFEACYYQAIEFAINNRLQWVEAGAQGPHKIQRGYLPCPTYSAHWIADPAFRDAVARYLEEERAAVEHESRELAAESPYRRSEQAIDGLSIDRPVTLP